jgi:hypothetical protein
MLSYGTATFTDPDEYRVRASMNLVPNGRREFEAPPTWVKLHRLTLVRVQESLPCIGFPYPGTWPGLHCIGFSQPSAHGRNLGLGAIVLHGNQGDRLYQWFGGQCRCGMISLTPKDLLDYGHPKLA